MEPNITFKGIKSSPEVTAHATRKLSKIDRYSDFKFIEARYIFRTETENSIHIAELILFKNDRISAVAREKSMYHAIDEVVAKICKQLEKKKTHYKQLRHDLPRQQE